MTKNNKTAYITAALITLSAMFATGCNTIEGVGEDLESAGDKAEEVTKN